VTRDESTSARCRWAARAAHYERGPAATFDDVAKRVPGLPARFVAEQAELAGFPVWSSAPDTAFYGVES